MMKKLLLCSAVFLMGTAMSFAQFANIGILGGSTVTGWDSDTDMVTTDGVTYTLNNVVITVPPANGGVKFRQDDAWTINWGSDAWPTGTGTQGGADIPAVNGTYNVMFNRLTGEYMFMDPTAGVDSYEAVTFKVYPNPTQNVWNFSAANSVINNLQIVDVSGKVIFSAANSATVDATSFASGVYFARVTSANAVQTIRVIKH
jgi:hypothetical protein